MRIDSRLSLLILASIIHWTATAVEIADSYTPEWRDYSYNQEGQLASLEASRQKSADSVLAQIAQPSCAASTRTLETHRAKPVAVVYFRGFVWDWKWPNNAIAGDNILSSVRKAAAQLGYKDVHTIASFWEDHRLVCDLLARHPDREVILIGHSYGVAGAVLLSNCLAKHKIKTPLLISMGAFDFNSGANVERIPPHIGAVYNL